MQVSAGHDNTTMSHVCLHLAQIHALREPKVGGTEWFVLTQRAGQL